MNAPSVLSYEEMTKAANAGVMRQIQEIRTGSHNAHGLEPGHDWEYAIEGALAEYAFALYMKLPWTATGNKGNPDFDGWEVKMTQRQNGSLIIRKADAPGYYVLTIYKGEGAVEVHHSYHYKEWDDKLAGDPDDREKVMFVPQTRCNVQLPPFPMQIP